MCLALNISSCYFCFCLKLSLCSPGCPGTHDPPASESSVLGLQVYITMLGSLLFFMRHALDWGKSDFLWEMYEKYFEFLRT
jgi:hypothetical protein